MKLAGAYINDDTYERLAALAAANNRTLAGQCRHLFDRALRGELEVPLRLPAVDAAPATAQPLDGQSRPAGVPAGRSAAVPAPVRAAAQPRDAGRCGGGPCSGRCAQGGAAGGACPSAQVADRMVEA